MKLSQYCFTFQKSIKSQQEMLKETNRRDCFTFQKSIKSQPRSCDGEACQTVSHFKRASNHNCLSRFPSPAPTVSHFKRASNHNARSWRHTHVGLFHISKEHQITTTMREGKTTRYCFTFQKSIKSQLYPELRAICKDCFTFQKSIKSQPRL